MLTAISGYLNYFFSSAKKDFSATLMMDKLIRFLIAH